MLLYQWMVDGLMIACCNAQADEDGQAGGALERGQWALQELRELGWEEKVYTRLFNPL